MGCWRSEVRIFSSRQKKGKALLLFQQGFFIPIIASRQEVGKVGSSNLLIPTKKRKSLVVISTRLFYTHYRVTTRSREGRKFESSHPDKKKEKPCCYFNRAFLYPLSRPDKKSGRSEVRIFSSRQKKGKALLLFQQGFFIPIIASRQEVGKVGSSNLLIPTKKRKSLVVISTRLFYTHYRVPTRSREGRKFESSHPDKKKESFVVISTRLFYTRCLSDLEVPICPS